MQGVCRRCGVGKSGEVEGWWHGLGNSIAVQPQPLSENSKFALVLLTTVSLTLTLTC